MTMRKLFLLSNKKNDLSIYIICFIIFPYISYCMDIYTHIKIYNNQAINYYSTVSFKI